MSFKSNLNVWILFGNIDGNVVKLLLSNLNSVKDVHADILFVNELNKILIKTNINGSTIVFDDYYYFKVING